MRTSKDSPSYILYVLGYGNIENPIASDLEETARVIDGLSRASKAYFVRDTPKTVQEVHEKTTISSY